MRRTMIAATGMLAVAALLAMPAVSFAEEPSPAPVDTVAEKVAAAAAGGADGPQALADAAGLPVAGPASLQLADDGTLAATVQFAAIPTEAQLARVRELARIDRVYTVAPAVAVHVDPERLSALAGIDGVISASPDLAPVVGSGQLPTELVGALAPAVPVAAALPGSCRSLPVDGDAILGAKQAREEYGVDGTGVTVGIISDSYGRDTAITSPAQDVAAGLLPGPGNPCGYETPVEVVREMTASGAEDEGRAMAQLVHGIAPGARLLFASGSGGGQVGMAQAIDDLVAAGADVIVDDLSFPGAPYFQQGLISRSVMEARDAGIGYYTSATNFNQLGAQNTRSTGRPISSWQTPRYRPTACPAWVQVPVPATDYDCLDFSPQGAGDPTDLIGLNGLAAPRFVLNWGEPVTGVTTVFLPQLYSNADTPQLVQDGALVDAINPSAVTLDGSSGPIPSGEYNLVVVRVPFDDQPETPAIFLGTFAGTDALAWREHDRSVGPDVVGPMVGGHAGDGSAASVAAVDWRNPVVAEYFSSIGPGTVLFEPYDPLSPTPARALPEPVTTNAPLVAGLDNQVTSFFPADDPQHRFQGTSAAAPTVAAVHALAASYTPSASADTIRALLASSCQELINSYQGFADEAVFGCGLVDAKPLLDRLPPAAPGSVTATAASATSVSASWAPVAQAVAYSVDLLQGDTVVTTVDVPAATTATTFDGLVPDTEYRVRVSGVKQETTERTYTTSATVRTPIPPRPSVTPPAPSESSLDAAHRGSTGVSVTTARPGETVTLTGLPQNAWVFGWIYSTPVSLGWAWTGAAGSAAFTIPADLPAGLHRIAVTDAAGTVLGWVEVRVAASALAATGLGVDLAPAGLAAVAAVAGGAVLLLARRRRVRA
jgi:hypothetical protein